MNGLWIENIGTEIFWTVASFMSPHGASQSCAAPKLFARRFSRHGRALLRRGAADLCSIIYGLLVSNVTGARVRTTQPGTITVQDFAADGVTA
jgi:hypothetical protein